MVDVSTRTESPWGIPGWLEPVWRAGHAEQCCTMGCRLVRLLRCHELQDPQGPETGTQGPARWIVGAAQAGSTLPRDKYGRIPLARSVAFGAPPGE